MTAARDTPARSHAPTTRAPRGAVVALAFGLSLFIAGCSRSAPDSTPEGALRLWLERMEASTDDPRAMRDAYALLGPAARENLGVRARRMTTYTGKHAESEDMLAPGRFGLKFRPKSMKSTVAGDSATVDVQGSDPSEHASVRCVRVTRDVARGDGWRIEPELPELLSPLKRDGG
jgi:hypothetical protein